MLGKENEGIQIKKASSFWLDYNQKKAPFEWASEACIRNYVVDITTECGQMAGLQFMPELSLFKEDEADILISTLYGIPVGVVEVKRQKIQTKVSHCWMMLKIWGQLFDHLSHLRMYAWRQYAFGILTTYKKWRICWHPDNSNVAEATAILSSSFCEHSTAFPKQLPD